MPTIVAVAATRQSAASASRRQRSNAQRSPKPIVSRAAPAPSSAMRFKNQVMGMLRGPGSQRGMSSRDVVEEFPQLAARPKQRMLARKVVHATDHSAVRTGS